MSMVAMSEDRIRLYAQGSHTLSHALAFGVVGMITLGVAASAYELLHTHDYAGLPFLALFGLIGSGAVRTILRARRIYGTSAGLGIGSGTIGRTILWAKIGDPQIPLSSLNPVFRTYYIEVLGEAERIYFFAGKSEIERIEEFKSRYRNHS
jgi:hypothetical protein